MNLLEVACDTVSSALAAQAGGADRIELVAALGEGGLTPSLGKFLAIKEQVDIPVFVMIRPRRADFCYAEADFAEMLRDVALFREHGADGLVSGVLLPNGTVDQTRTAQLREAAGPLPFTFHRAIDLCVDLPEAMETLIRLGIDRILTSGGEASAPAGADMIRALAEQAQGRIALMAGAGVTPDTLPTLLNIPGLTEFHASAKKVVASQMTHRGRAAMGHEAADTEYRWYESDQETIATLKRQLA